MYLYLLAFYFLLIGILKIDKQKKKNHINHKFPTSRCFVLETNVVIVCCCCWAFLVKKATSNKQKRKKEKLRNTGIMLLAIAATVAAVTVAGVLFKFR